MLIFINLLTPYYAVQKDEIKKELLDIYINEGGKVHDASILSFNFNEKNNHRLELDSFEGLIDFDKLDLFHHELPNISLSKNIDSWRVMGTTLDYSLLPLDSSKLFSLTADSSGVNCILRVYNAEEQTRVEVSYKAPVGTSVEVWWNNVEPLISNKLKNLERQKHVSSLSSWKVLDSAIPVFENKLWNFKKKSIYGTRKISCDKKQVSNVQYCGDFVGHSHGKFGQLMNLS